MIVLRVLIGLLKGAVIGGGLGAGAWLVDPEGTTLSSLRWPLYGAVGFLVGIVGGKPPWAPGAAWVASILKAIVGFGLCVGLFFLADWLIVFDVYGRDPTNWYFAFGAVLGSVYGIWVEIDDGERAARGKDSKKSKQKKKSKKKASDDKGPEDD